MPRILVSTLLILAAVVAFAAYRFGAAPASQPAPMDAAEARVETPSAADDKAIRVVYPPPTQTSAAIQAQPVAKPDPVPAKPAAPPAEAVAATDMQAPPQAQEATPQADLDAVLRATAKIDLNTASVEELDKIPGGGRIGRAIARHRPYGSVEDLLSKHVLRRSVYDRIKDEVAAR